MTFSIRPATEADLVAVREIAYATWPDTFREILSEAQIDYMLNWLYAIPRLQTQMRTGEHIIHLAEVESTAVGFIAYQLGHPDATSAKIHKLYLRPTFQGRGIGLALLQTARRAAESAGHTRLVLNVNKYNKAVRFYEANGFVQAGEEVIDIGGGYVMDDYIMQQRLPDERG